MKPIRLSIILTCAFNVMNCGSDSSPADINEYSSDPGVVGVVGNGSGTVFQFATDGTCIPAGNPNCADALQKCGADARADVIVDSTGKVIEIVCYTTNKEVPLLESPSGVSLGNNNNSIVTLDATADGADIAGDLNSEGNKVTVFGQGPAVSQIDGAVNANGNNFALRGVTVKKDVVVKGNDATLVYCNIEGNVTIEGNNTVIAECTIFGNLTIKGNNTKMTAVNIGGNLSIEGDNTVCDKITGFNDANTNKTIDTGELGNALTCEKKTK